MFWGASSYYFVPWDVYIEQPPVGSWQRTLNDFFESLTGEIFLWVFYITYFSIGTLYLAAQKWSSISRIVITNLIILVTFRPLALGAEAISQFFRPTRDGFDPFFYSYGENALSILVIFLLLGFWTREIIMLSNRSAKRKNNMYDNNSIPQEIPPRLLVSDEPCNQMLSNQQTSQHDAISVNITS